MAYYKSIHLVQRVDEGISIFHTYYNVAITAKCEAPQTRHQSKSEHIDDYADDTWNYGPD